jgi:hypothetical protein
MTHNVTSLQSIDALRKAHSITSSALARSDGGIGVRIHMVLVAVEAPPVLLGPVRIFVLLPVTIDIVLVDSLKALDPERPIREEKRTWGNGLQWS